MEHEARSCDYQSLLRDPVRGQLSHLRPHIHFCSISFSVFLPSAIPFFLVSFWLGGPCDLLMVAMKQTLLCGKKSEFSYGSVYFDNVCRMTPQQTSQSLYFDLSVSVVSVGCTTTRKTINCIRFGFFSAVEHLYIGLLSFDTLHSRRCLAMFRRNLTESYVCSSETLEATFQTPRCLILRRLQCEDCDCVIEATPVVILFFISKLNDLSLHVSGHNWPVKTKIHVHCMHKDLMFYIHHVL